MSKLNFVNSYFCMLTVFRILSITLLPTTASPLVKLINHENIYKLLLLISDVIWAIVDSRPTRTGSGIWLLFTMISGYIFKLTGSYMIDSLLWVLIIYAVYLKTDAYLFDKRKASNTNNQEQPEPDVTLLNGIVLSLMVILASCSFMYFIFNKYGFVWDLNCSEYW